MGPQRDEPVRLGPVPAHEHPGDGGFEVVVPDPARDPAEVLERGHMACQERLLGLGGVGDVERLATARQAHHEHPYLDHRASQQDLELAEVDRGLSAARMDLADEHLPVGDPQLDPPHRDIARDGDLGQPRAVLGDQPLPDPPCGVPLLAAPPGPRSARRQSPPATDRSPDATGAGTPSSAAARPMRVPDALCDGARHGGPPAP